MAGLQGANNGREGCAGVFAAARQCGDGIGKAAILFSAEPSLPDGRRVRYPKGRVDRLCPNEGWLVVCDVYQPQNREQHLGLDQVGTTEKGGDCGAQAMTASKFHAAARNSHDALAEGMRMGRSGLSRSSK